MCIVHVRRGFNKSCNNLCPILLPNLSQLNSITLHYIRLYGYMDTNTTNKEKRDEIIKTFD